MLERLRPALIAADRILVIAPSRQVLDLLARHSAAPVVGLDLEAVRPIDLRADLCALPFVDDAFDVVICSNVLEHIPDDHTAMRSLTRVLRPSGLAVIQVPRRRGEPTEEDPSATLEERVRKFGQEDHVRLYGDDFEERLLREGMHARTLAPSDFIDELEIERCSIAHDEEIWICGVDGTPRMRLEEGMLATDRLALDVLGRRRDDLAQLREVELTQRHRIKHLETEVSYWRDRYERLAGNPLVSLLLAARRLLRRLSGSTER